MSETGCAESICSLSGIWACWFLCECVFVCVCVYVRTVPVCVCCIYNMCTPLADVQKLLKDDNFPLITLMPYSAAILSVISPLLGRTTHIGHMLADCQANRHALITENASYKEMKKEIKWAWGIREEWEEQENCLHFVIWTNFIEFSHDGAQHLSLCLTVFWQQNQADKHGWQIVPSETFETIGVGDELQEN